MMCNNISKLLFIGSAVPLGRLDKLYSAHKEVINFLYKDLAISLCAGSVCPGKYRIILDADSVEGVHSMELLPEMLILNGDNKLSVLAEMLYTCAEFSYISDSALLQQRLKSSYAEFRDKAIPESVLGLVLHNPMEDSRVNRLLASWYSRGIEHFKQGNYADAVQCFRHRGLGLTPAGDDFLIGMLLGMAWLMRVQKKELSRIMDLILHESDVIDPLIRTFILQAFRLELDADWAGLLNSFCDHGSSYKPWLHKILSHGASSGADQLSGFYLACDLFGTGMDLPIKSL